MSSALNAMGSKVRPITRRSLAQQAADELRDLILLEKLAPGAPIPEREMADALGVSRTPLRESLRILSTEGLVEIEPNRPPRVADPSLDELHQLLLVQGTLEALAGELACANASDAELANILEQQQRLNDMSDSAELLEFFRHDMAFHEAIISAAHNRPLLETHATYNARLWRARFISSRLKVNRSGALEEHRRIAEALYRRDAEGAKLHLRSHLETGYDNICKVREGRIHMKERNSA